MILADKIINLRKKSGLSQEELAVKLNVSRQAVSKWEGAQSIPDLDKILAMSQIFGVTTDFLLKDELEVEEPSEVYDESSKEKKVPMQMASEFISIKNNTAKFIAIGVLLCILSPIALIALGGMAETLGWNEGLMCGIGIISMLILVAIAVCLFLFSDNKQKNYEFITVEKFETEYGVVGMVKEKKKQFQDSYFKNNLIGIVLCILGVIPLFVGAFSDNDLYAIIGLVCMFFIVSIGVFFIVLVNCKMGALTRLLQEGDYTKENKDVSSATNIVSTCYWTVATAIFLIWSFLGDAWEISWLTWVIAGVLYPIALAISKAVDKKKK